MKKSPPSAAQTFQDFIDHLEVLYTTLESELASVISKKKDLVAHGVMEFGKLWTLFEPGCLIYRKSDGHDRIYRLKTGTFSTVGSASAKAYMMSCQYVDFDGTNFGYSNETINIFDFKGTKKISKLGAFPPQFHSDPEELKTRLTDRGRMFEAFKGYHFVAYDGVAIGKVQRGDQKFNVSSRIIIDAYSSSRYSGMKPALELFETPELSQDAVPLASGEETDDDCVMLDENVGRKPNPAPVGRKPDPIVESLLTPEQHLIASVSVRGYSLRDKKWFTFFVDHVKDIVWNEDAFASLVAPQEQKDLILSFAESQIKSRGDFDDFIQGKGQGIIMLLAGPPGVGKTLTAESVAEEMRVPLYSIGAADLGSESDQNATFGIHRRRTSLNNFTGKPNVLENKLHDILEMCSKWNAGKLPKLFMMGCLIAHTWTTQDALSRSI